MKIHYVSGSRADFGLMRRSLERLNENAEIELGVVATGQHLIAQYGSTIKDIEASNIKIVARIAVELSGSSGAEMARALACQLTGCLEYWEKDRPDLVLVLGDRGEMVAATLAAIHLGIHVAHLHGGEVSGTIDESFRHAISKMCHFHLPCSEDSRRRLLKMGECSNSILIVGAPGLVGIRDSIETKVDIFDTRFALDKKRKRILCVFHPVVQESADVSFQMHAILQMLDRSDSVGLILRPNADSGGLQINKTIDSYLRNPKFAGKFVALEHLERDSYLNALYHADLIVGNSSSGIIESASLNTPCLNIGTRQSGRLRNDNTVDCLSYDDRALDHALNKAIELIGPFENFYGDETTDKLLEKFLPQLPLTADVLAKRNSY